MYLRSFANHNTFPNQSRHFKAIFIFYQYLIFPLKTSDNASTCRIQETDLVSYLYITHILLCFYCCFILHELLLSVVHTKVIFFFQFHTKTKTRVHVERHIYFLFYI